MPIIRPSSDLRNKYTEIAAYCHQTPDPVFITKNGVGDLAVMSMEAYERLAGIHSLRMELEQGLRDVREGKTLSATDAFRLVDKEQA